MIEKKWKSRYGGDPVPWTSSEFVDWLRKSPESPFKLISYLEPFRTKRLDHIRICGARSSLDSPDYKVYVAFEGLKMVGYLSVEPSTGRSGTTNVDRCQAYGRPVEFQSTPAGSHAKPLTTFLSALKARRPRRGKKS